MTDTLTTQPDQSLSVPMPEVTQGNHEGIDQMFKELMALEVPAFVIRAALSADELATVNQAIANHDTYSVEPLAALHDQARGHLEKHTNRPYVGTERYDGKPLTQPQINRMPAGKGLGAHIDASPFSPSLAREGTTVALHTVVDGNVDVAATGYNYRTDQLGEKPPRGTLDPDVQTTSLGAGDSIVFRQDGDKPTHHNFVSPDGGDRTSAIMQLRPGLEARK